MASGPLDTYPEHPDHVAATGEALRETLRHVASPVVVVTLRASDGPRGATIGSFASVSLDPPLVSFNVTHDTRLHDALGATDELAIHLLAADQADMAAHFAIPDLTGADQLAPFPHTRPEDGPPLLDAVQATLLSSVSARVEAGDHTLVIAAVREIRPGRAAEPLLYYATEASAPASKACHELGSSLTSPPPSRHPRARGDPEAGGTPAVRPLDPRSGPGMTV